MCWWETFSEAQHENLGSWQREREEFDRYYSDSVAGAIQILGSPLIEGTDTIEDRHSFAIWRGKTGMLILQQSAYDPQFGHDVNYWVQPWSGPDPRPTSPFSDWLSKLSAGS